VYLLRPRGGVRAAKRTGGAVREARFLLSFQPVLNKCSSETCSRLTPDLS
jgi:hypothetical protein